MTSIGLRHRFGRVLLCRILRRHVPLRVIDRVEMEAFDGSELRGRITADHHECRRCLRTLNERKP